MVSRMPASRWLPGHTFAAWAALWLLCLAGFVALGIRASSGDVLAADLRIARWVQAGPPFFGRLTDVANSVNLAPVLAVLIIKSRQPCSPFAAIFSKARPWPGL
jgi:hypothetical protein